MEARLIVDKQIQQAREALNLSPEGAATLLGIQLQKLQEWEQGISQPSLDQLRQLAQLYGRSIDYFLSPTPFLPTEVSFRSSIKEREIRNFELLARKAIVEVEELCRTYKELEALLDRPRKIQVKPYSKELEVDELATKVRQDLGLGERPIRDLHKVLRGQGILIFELDIPEDVFSGFSCWYEEYGPVILLNIKDFLPRRRFTLAHEYAHLLYGEGTVVCGHKLDYFTTLDITEERLASQFAATFLIPAYDLEEQFEQRGYKVPPSETQIGDLAKRYNVSLQALTIRLEGLELAPKGSAQEFIERVIGRRGEKFPWIYRRPLKAKAPWERKFGEDYSNLALEAYKKELVSLGRLAYYLRTDTRTAMDIAAMLE